MNRLPRLVIVEGPDGAGKSTLVEQLRTEYEHCGEFRQVRVVHHGPYHGEEKIAGKYFTPMARCIVEQDTALIMDRSWLSEPIYGAVLRGGQSRITYQEDRMLSRAALALDVQIVLCLPPLETVLENRPEDATWLADVHQCYAHYFASEGIRIGWNLPKPIEFDYTEDYFRTGFLRARRYLNEGPGAGVFCPGSVLMVGDRPNTARHGDVKHRVPFVSFGRRDGCSWWLADQLDEAEVSELTLYWINAYDFRGEPTSADFLRTMLPRHVVLLGVNAIKWYKQHASKISRELDIEMLVLEEYHPMAWKRFHFNEPYRMINELKKKVS